MNKKSKLDAYMEASQKIAGDDYKARFRPTSERLKEITDASKEFHENTEVSLEFIEIPDEEK